MNVNAIEIRDPNINAKDILDRVAERVQEQAAPDYSAIGPENLHSAQTNIPLTDDAKSADHELFIDLIMMHQLEEAEFSSETPIIGPWIVRLRELWNWMSTKWYVRPILRQQSTVNGQIVLLLVEMNALLKENRQTITQLEERVNQLESLIATNQSPKK